LLKRIVSGMMLTLLLIIVLTLTFNVQQVKGEMFTPNVVVSPEHPLTEDNINITVSFYFHTWPPFVKEFGSLIKVGNTFSVNVTILVPDPLEGVLLIVHTDVHTYNLGYLPEGKYQFQIYMRQQLHATKGSYYLAKSVFFTVSPPPFPLSVSTFKNDVPVTSNMTLLDENKTTIQTVNDVSAYDWLLPSGTYYVQASIFYNGFAYTSEQAKVDLTSDTKLAINLLFGNLTVSCLDVENRPLKNCTVVFVRQDEERVGYTDDSGSASLEAYYGNWTVKAYWMNALVGEANINMNQPEANLNLRCNVRDSTATQNIAPLVSGTIAAIAFGSFSVWTITKRKRQTTKQ
jgi:hypothetical protein